MNWFRRIKLGQVNGVSFVPHRNYSSQTHDIVYVDPAKFDKDWQKGDEYFYIGKGGKGADFKYNNFGKWLEKGEPVETPMVGLDGDGNLGFYDGRNRFAWLRDRGLNRIPVAVKKEHAPILKEKYN